MACGGGREVQPPVHVEVCFRTSLQLIQKRERRRLGSPRVHGGRRAPPPSADVPPVAFRTSW